MTKEKENREIFLNKSKMILKKIERAYKHDKESDRQFAGDIGLSTAMYNQIKNGSRVLGLDSMVSMEKKLGIPISQLLKLSETENYSKKGGYRWINSIGYEDINHESELYNKIFQGLMDRKSPEKLEPLLKENGYSSLPFVKSFLDKADANLLTPVERIKFFVNSAYSAICSKSIRLLINDSNLREVQNNELQEKLSGKIKKHHPSFLEAKILINPLHKSFNHKKFSLMPAFIGKFCSHYIKTFLSQNLNKRYIGLAGGFSVFSMVNQIFTRDDIFPPSRYHTTYELVPLYLEPFGEFKSFVAESIVSNLFLTLYTGSMSSNLKSYIMHPYTYQNDKEELITKDSNFRMAQHPLQNLDIAVCGCGDRYQPSALLNELMERYARSIKNHEEVVTDLCGNLLKKDGEPFELKLAGEEFIPPGISLRQLQRMAGDSEKRVIVLAAGEAKTEAIMSIIKGKYLNVLIVDEQLGESLIKLL